MQKKVFISFGNLVAALFFSAVFCFVFFGQVLAATFDIANYPGYCVAGDLYFNGDLTVGLSCCADGGQSNYTYPYTGTLTVNYPSTCTCIFSYGNWGTCTSGYRSRTMTSQSPSGASCSNTPVTTETCDSTPPTVSISAPYPNGTTVNGTTVPITFSAGDNVMAEYADIYIDTTVVGTVTVNSTSTSKNYTWDSTTVGDGSHTIKVMVYDTSDNTNYAVRDVTVSNAALAVPTVSFANPANGATVSGPVTMRANAAVSTGSIYKVEFYVDGTLKGTDTSSPYEYSWPTTGSPDGSHQLKAIAYTASMVTSEVTISVTVDNLPDPDVTPPTVAFSVPVDGDIVDGTVDVAATATDPTVAGDATSGVHQLKFYVDGTLKQTDTSSPYTYTWYTTTVADGSHILKVEAYDVTGNSSVKEITVEVDNVAPADTTDPTVEITQPAAGDVVEGTVQIKASATDPAPSGTAASGMYVVKFYINGELVVSDTSSPYEYTWYTTGGNDGEYEIKVEAYDVAGNSSTDTLTVEVDNVVTGSGGGGGGDSIPPVVEITHPDEGATVGGIVTVVINVTDAGGVHQVKLYVDGDFKETDDSSPFGFSWNTTGLNNGDYKLTVKAYDVAGNNSSDEVEVKVSNVSSYTVPVTCQFDCKKWNECETSGKQTCAETVTTPAGATCSNALKTALTQNCTYIAPKACAYTCNKWGTCQESGKQTCVEYANSATGANCPSAPSEALTQNCTYSAPVTCSYPCNKWGECSSSNIQTCIEVMTVPAGANCANPLAATPVKNCSNEIPTTSCVFNCNKWGNCSADGKQICLGFSQTPVLANCTNPKPEFPSQACTYSQPKIEEPKETQEVANADDTETEDTKTNNETAQSDDKTIDRGPSRSGSSSKEEIPCLYVYSQFGACVNGSHSRIAISKSPDNCVEKVQPAVLTETCEEVEAAPRPEDAPLPAPVAVMAIGAAKAQENAEAQNYNGRTDVKWQKYYFGAEECYEAAVCGGDADPDNDGLTNNEEYRFGTDPKDADTDNDGYVDAGEIRDRRDPLVAATDGMSDKMIADDPKTSAAGNEGIYSIDTVETVGGEKGKKIAKLTGKAAPNSYVMLFVFSDPIVLSIETNDDGSWSYVLDRPLELGNHEVYVAVTSNTGKIVAKSDKYVFAQTAEAAVALASPGDTEDRAPSPVKSRMNQGYFLVGILSIIGVGLAVIAIGLMRSKKANQ